MKTLKIFATNTILTVVTALFSLSQAHASVVDFEDQSAGLYFSGSSITSGGYSVTHSGGFASIQGDVGQGATEFSGNGTHRLVAFNQSTISFSNVLGSAFDLFSFEGGESWITQPHFWATQIKVVGTYLNGGTTTAIFDLDLVKNPHTGLQLFNLDSSFQGLISVAFNGIGVNPEFTLDNINVSSTSVPEPHAVLLMLVGLFALGFKARTQKA